MYDVSPMEQGDFPLPCYNPSLCCFFTVANKKTTTAHNAQRHRHLSGTKKHPLQEMARNGGPKRVKLEHLGCFFLLGGREWFCLFSWWFFYGFYVGKSLWNKPTIWGICFFSNHLKSKSQKSKVITWRIIPVSKWLITMDSFRPLRIGLFPFQMAFPWLIK